MNLPLLTKAQTSNDLVSTCPACTQAISVSEELFGERVECPFCQHQFTVDEPTETSDLHEKNRARMQIALAEMENQERQLQENVTQTTELKGIMSRLTIELHRHQLRLDKLSERQQELNSAVHLARMALQNI